MKATITAIPSFNIIFNNTLVDILIKLSAAHYDGKCQDASKPRGFLYGWKNQVEDSEEEISATSFELDLSLKIAEDFMRTLPEDEQKIIVDYRAFVMKLMDESRQLGEISINIDQ